MRNVPNLQSVSQFISRLLFVSTISFILCCCTRSAEQLNEINNLEMKFRNLNLKIRPLSDKEVAANKLKGFKDWHELEKYLSNLKKDTVYIVNPKFTLKEVASKAAPGAQRTTGVHTYQYMGTSYVNYMDVYYFAYITYQSNGNTATNTITDVSSVTSSASTISWTSSGVFYDSRFERKYTHLSGTGNIAGSGSTLYLDWSGKIDDTETGVVMGYEWEISRTTTLILASDQVSSSSLPFYID
ncbi:MAG: hypothetical protein J7502_07690 [Flavisolibacter sp.]|nr:hypothetical protein [Flavisolibacter sp.]